MKICLAGLPGSGKSSVGKILADKLGIRFFDLDRTIEEEEKESIADIFSQRGESVFRELETQTLHRLLSSKEDCVIALGGGSPASSLNRQMIAENSISVYLETGIDTIISRLGEKDSGRPLYSAGSISRLLSERERFYLLSEMRISTDTPGADEVAGKIADFIKRKI